MTVYTYTYTYTACTNSEIMYESKCHCVLQYTDTERNITTGKMVETWTMKACRVEVLQETGWRILEPESLFESKYKQKQHCSGAV